MSTLSEECDAAISTPIENMTLEQLSLLIQQQADLARIMPRAIVELSENPFVMAAHYRGDLLKNLLRVNAKYWTAHRDQWLRVHSILSDIEEIQAEIADAKFAFFDLK